MDAHLPQEWSALCLLVFMLGMRHGFDADHLATIDGLTRFNARSNPRLARFCGTLFSLGHGAVVLAIALGVSLLSASAPVPEWLEGLGTAISVLFLLSLGAVNLHAVLTCSASEIVAPVGFKGRLLGRLNRAANPWLIALVGALFALSFDTISQAALFALTGVHHGGLDHALVLGILFLLGMLVTDGVNGLWISRLIRRADQAALIASRVMGLAVGSVSLMVGFFALARNVSPAVADWSEGKELFFGMAVVLAIFASYMAAVHMVKRPAFALIRSR